MLSQNEEEDIKPVIGKLKGEDTTTVQSYLFAKDKDGDLEKAKAWFERHKESLLISNCAGCKRTKEHVSTILPFKVLEKIVDKPLKVRGVAMTVGMSRNFNIYTPEELQAFASKLVNSPVYIEHVSVDSAVGKVTKTDWDGHALWYEAEIYESEVADKIRKGLVQHVSVGADYEAIDVVDGKVPHGLHNAELSLVAVSGIPETNVQILEKLAREKVDPLVAGEYFLGFYQDPALFLPEHFRTVWLDQANGVLAVMARSRVDPVQERCQAILFLKGKWQLNTVQDWLAIHPDYVSPAGALVSPGTPSGIENMSKIESKWEKKTLEGRVRFLEALQQLKEQGLSQAEVEAKLGELIKQRDAWYQEFEAIEVAIQQASDVEREKHSARLNEINVQLDLLWAEIEAYQQTLAGILSVEQASEGEGLQQVDVEVLRKELGETKDKLIETEAKLTDAESKLSETEGKLAEADKTVEDLRKQLPGGGLLKDPPKMMPVSEHVAVLEGLLLSPLVERSSLGEQKHHQLIRREIWKAKERIKSGQGHN
jgi:transcriptional regulator with XRE-family HTH domain